MSTFAIADTAESPTLKGLAKIGAAENALKQLHIFIEDPSKLHSWGLRAASQLVSDIEKCITHFLYFAEGDAAKAVAAKKQEELDALREAAKTTVKEVFEEIDELTNYRQFHEWRNIFESLLIIAGARHEDYTILAQKGETSEDIADLIAAKKRFFSARRAYDILHENFLDDPDRYIIDIDYYVRRFEEFVGNAGGYALLDPTLQKSEEEMKAYATEAIAVKRGAINRHHIRQIMREISFRHPKRGPETADQTKERIKPFSVDEIRNHVKKQDAAISRLVKNYRRHNIPFSARHDNHMALVILAGYTRVLYREAAKELLVTMRHGTFTSGQAIDATALLKEYVEKSGDPILSPNLSSNHPAENSEGTIIVQDQNRDLAPIATEEKAPSKPEDIIRQMFFRAAIHDLRYLMMKTTRLSLDSALTAVKDLLHIIKESGATPATILAHALSDDDEPIAEYSNEDTVKTLRQIVLRAITAKAEQTLSGNIEMGGCIGHCIPCGTSRAIAFFFEKAAKALPELGFHRLSDEQTSEIFTTLREALFAAVQRGDAADDQPTNDTLATLPLTVLQSLLGQPRFLGE